MTHPLKMADRPHHAHADRRLRREKVHTGLTDDDKRLLQQIHDIFDAPNVLQGVEESGLIEEAINRGASERFLVDYFAWRGRYRKGPVAVRHELRKVLEPFFTAYRNKVSDEFKAIQSLKGFADPDPETARTPEEHYFHMRPLYYESGFNNPAKGFLSKIKPFTFLGKPVPGGLHEEFTKDTAGLGEVRSILESRSPGLSDRVAASITKQDGGLVPRFIAGSTDLSNHAFGLAIDVDPLTNPMLLGGSGKGMIALLNEVVKRQTGSAFDFGSQFAFDTSTAAWGEHTRTVETYEVAKRGSDAVSSWLGKILDTYEHCLADIAAGRAAHASASARENAKEAQRIIDSEPDLQLIQKLHRTTDPQLRSLRAWRERGVQSLPFELVWAIRVAFKTNPWFRWGQEYKSRKDSMHFELQAVIKGNDGSLRAGALKPDATRVRPLRELFPLSFLMCYSPEFDDFINEQNRAGAPALPPGTYQ